jgi:hypothetical protein
MLYKKNDKVWISIQYSCEITPLAYNLSRTAYNTLRTKFVWVKETEIVYEL